MSTENNAASGRVVSTGKGSDGLKQTAASPGAIWGTVGNAANALGGLFPNLITTKEDMVICPQDQMQDTMALLILSVRLTQQQAVL